MITALINTYNEEKNIQRCLTSLSWVDEILIVDMQSKDRTVEIARKNQVKIIEHPYTGFVEPARNFGIEKTKGEWVLIIDADEEIPKPLADFLVRTTQIKNVDYYRIPRKNIIFNKWIKHAGWWPDYQTRFFKKGSVVWSDKIHGIPLTYGKGEDLDPTQDLSITHYNYQSFEQYLDRLNRYTSISAKQLHKENTHTSLENLFSKPTGEFVKRFFLEKGYLDGWHGLTLSLLQSFSELVTYLKLWELGRFQEKRISLDEIENFITKDYQNKKYWLFTELLNTRKNFINKIYLKAKRKLINSK